MVTEALSSEETTVETAITAVSGLSSYFSAVVALAVGSSNNNGCGCGCGC